MDFGDELIDQNEPQFTHGEAVEITGVPSLTINNWRQREIVELGTMHRTGRRLYSMLDLMELRVVGELSEMVKMPVAKAAAAGSWVRDRAFWMSERDETGELRYRGTKHEVRDYLILSFQDGQHKIYREKGCDWLKNYQWAHPIVVVPLDDIVTSVLKSAINVLQREHDSIGLSNSPKSASPPKTKAKPARKASPKKRSGKK